MVAVTGGARGIGAATADVLRSRGAKVAIGDLDPEGDAIALDVTDRGSFTAFLDEVERRHGPLDVLVNNAGVMHVGPFLQESDDWSRRQLDINLWGVILGMKLALPRMLARGGGHVVNIASMAARIGIRNEAVYSASKHGVYGVSEGVRHELRGTGVELTVVMPGLVRTELAAGTLQGSVVLSPRDVGTAIAGALERPRFDLYIPRRFGALDGLVRPLPRPARETILRALGTERNTAATTGSDRAAYERRVEAQQGRSGPDRLEDLHRDL